MNMHFYEGSYIKFDLESAKSQIGDNEKSLKLTHGPYAKTTVHLFCLFENFLVNLPNRLSIEEEV